MVKLLLGFYEPNKGQIKVGGLPLKEINPHVWRAHTGCVMQDGFLFSDTIAKNIAVGAEVIDKERLLHAVMVANIREFIDALPLGYNTRIGQEGNGLSQGQKQRILIARAVYKDPEFIFFDESLTAQSEYEEAKQAFLNKQRGTGTADDLALPGPDTGSAVATDYIVYNLFIILGRQYIHIEGCIIRMWRRSRICHK